MTRRVLIQLDCDPQPGTFDAIVAVDAGADVLLRHGNVTPDAVPALVHGAMFTRGPADLRHTAIFVGGSDVAAAEAVAARVRATFFGTVRVGVLVDPAGANTTAAATVVAVARHVPGGAAGRAVVLGGTGPVGRRVARLLARRGLAVHVASRSQARAEEAARAIRTELAAADVTALEWPGTVAAGGPAAAALAAADVVVAAGAAGASLLDAEGRVAAAAARVIVDLNAVPPAGVAGVVPADAGRRDGAAALYGAVGVGGVKMRIHRAALERVFADSGAFLDADDLLGIGQALA